MLRKSKAFETNKAPFEFCFVLNSNFLYLLKRRTNERQLIKSIEWYLPTSTTPRSIKQVFKKGVYFCR